VQLHFPQSLIRLPGDPPADTGAAQPVAKEPAPAEDPPAVAATAPALSSRTLLLAGAALLLTVVVGSVVMWVWDHALRAPPPTVVPWQYAVRPSPPPVHAVAQPKPPAPRVHRAPAPRPKPGTTKRECIRVLTDPSQDLCEQVPQ